MSRPDRLEPYSTNPARETIHVHVPPTVIGRARKMSLDLGLPSPYWRRVLPPPESPDVFAPLIRVRPASMKDA